MNPEKDEWGWGKSRVGLGEAWLEYALFSRNRFDRSLIPVPSNSE